MGNWSWPSREKLTGLRKRGVVPYSSFATRCLLLGIVLLTAVLGVKAFVAYGDVVKSFLETRAVAANSKTALKPFLSESYEFLLPITILAVVIICLSGLLQNRFLLQINLIKIDFTRFAGRSNLSVLKLCLNTFAAMIVVGLGVLFAWLLLKNSSEIVAVLLVLVEQGWSDSFDESLRAFGLLAGIALGLIGGLWWICRWLVFLWQHRTIETG